MSRPYQRLGIAELEQLAKRSWSDAGALGLIVDELDHRSTQRAMRLRARVVNRRAELESGVGAAPAAPTGSSPPGEPDPPPDFDTWAKRPPKRITAPGQPGQPQRPPRREPAQADDMAFEESGDLARDFSSLLKVHVEELEQLEAGSIVTVQGGERKQQVGGQWIYTFKIDDEVRLRDDTPVQIIVRGKPVSATIVSVTLTTLTIASNEDLGAYVEAAQIRTDQSFLMAKLKEAIDRVVAGEQTFSRALSDKVLGRAEPEAEVGEPLGGYGERELNAEQEEALRKSLGSDVLYVWGPPGTGKTHALAEIVLEHYRRGARVLIASNTNLAVDLLLRKVCERLAEAGDEGFDEGTVIRAGIIQDPQLEEQFGDRVDLEKVVARLSAQLVAERDEAQGKLDVLLPEIAAAQKVIEAFEEIDRVRREAEAAAERAEVAERRRAEAERKLTALVEERPRVEAELAEAERSGPLRNLVSGRSKNRLRDRLAQIQSEEPRLRTAIETERHALETAQREARGLEQRAAELESRMRGRSLATERARLAALEEKASPLRDRIAEIEAQLEALASETEQKARVLAATATQTYLRPSRFAGFDVVVLDEASMLTLPVVFYVAGLGQARAVVTGDFRQLAPIVQTKHPIIQDWFGRDVFDFAGIEKAVSERRLPPHLVQLKRQYRMDDAICQVVNSPFYGGTLETAKPAEPEGSLARPPPPFDGPLTIVDTSSEWPFANLRPGTFSRYNLIHALAVRALCRELRRSGFAAGRGAVGVVTPYAAQADLLKALLDESGLEEVEAGTVHRFQGNEKRLIVIDVPDGPGVPNLSQFLLANRLHEGGAKLFNVAFSRAREHLIVFANLTYLEESLPSDAFLRAILYDVQQRGAVLDLSDVLAIPTSELAARGPGALTASLELDDEKMLVVTQSDFDDYLLADIESAKESIVVFSGFCTERRVGQLADRLRHKIGQGVAVRCVTRPTDRQGGIPPDVVRRGIDGLEGLGAVVDLRQAVHEKLVVVDGRVCWTGSLNPLSHAGASDEIMTRALSPTLCAKVARLMSHTFKSEAEEEAALAAFPQRENPTCGGCKASTVAAKGRFGPYYYCAAGCGWKQNADGSSGRSRRRGRGGSRGGPAEPAETRTCPDCGQEMVIRTGRYGRFWGCTGYPECRSTANID